MLYLINHIQKTLFIFSRFKDFLYSPYFCNTLYIYVLKAIYRIIWNKQKNVFFVYIYFDISTPVNNLTLSIFENTVRK